MTRTSHIRVPKIVYWQPKADITAYELACALPAVFAMAHGKMYPEDDVATLSPEVRRHFDVRENAFK